MYKSAVQLLSRGAEANNPKYAPAVRQDERANRFCGHAAPHMLGSDKCHFETCGPGLDLEECGRPGTDEWVSPRENITMRFQFKTYFGTPVADALLLDDIRRLDPSITIVNIGRWGAAQDMCGVGSEYEQLRGFIDGLNASTGRPLLWIESQIKIEGGRQFDIAQAGLEPYRTWTANSDFGNFRFGVPSQESVWSNAMPVLDMAHFLRINLNHILNPLAIEAMYSVCFARYATNVSEKVLPLYAGHGFAGPFLDEVTALLMHYVIASVANDTKYRFNAAYPFDAIARLVQDTARGIWEIA